MKGIDDVVLDVNRILKRLEGDSKKSPTVRWAAHFIAAVPSQTELGLCGCISALVRQIEDLELACECNAGRRQQPPVEGGR